MKGASRALRVATAITFGGIALAVACLVVALSVAHGFEIAYKKSILDFNAHVVLLKDADFKNYKEVADKLTSYEGVIGVSPFLYRESMAVSNGVVKGVIIKGVDFKRLPTVSNIVIKPFAQSGDLTISPSHPATIPSAGRYLTIFLGKALAEGLDIKGASEINLMTGMEKFQKAQVIGTFESGLYDYDSQFALMPMGFAQRLFAAGDSVTGIEMRIENPDDAGLFTEMFEEEFTYPYQVTNWFELNRPIFEAVHLEKAMFSIILGVLVLVAMFNIIGALMLKILYKARDISTLGAIGMRLFLIRGIFTFHGTMLGIGAAFFGLVLGLIGTAAIGHFKLIHIEPEIYFLSSLPAVIEWNVCGLVLAASTLVSLLVSFAASTRVSGRHIVEGLR